MMESAAVDLRSTDPNTCIEALRLIMECSTRMFDLEDHREERIHSTRKNKQSFPDGVLNRIVELLQPNHSLSIRVQASHAVFNMSASRTVREHMSRANVITLLIQCLNITQSISTSSPHPSNETKVQQTQQNQHLDNPTSPSSSTLTRREQHELCAKNALGALANFAVSSDNKRRIVEEGALNPIVHILDTTTKDNARQQACRCLFALASDHANKYFVRSAIVNSGALRPLVQCLRHASSHVQWHAAGALANLSVSICEWSTVVIVTVIFIS